MNTQYCRTTPFLTSIIKSKEMNIINGLTAFSKSFKGLFFLEPNTKSDRNILTMCKLSFTLIIGVIWLFIWKQSNPFCGSSGLLSSGSDRHTIYDHFIIYNQFVSSCRNSKCRTISVPRFVMFFYVILPISLIWSNDVPNFYISLI